MDWNLFAFVAAALGYALDLWWYWHLMRRPLWAVKFAIVPLGTFVAWRIAPEIFGSVAVAAEVLLFELPIYVSDRSLTMEDRGDFKRASRSARSAWLLHPGKEERQTVCLRDTLWQIDRGDGLGLKTLALLEKEGISVVASRARAWRVLCGDPTRPEVQLAELSVGPKTNNFARQWLAPAFGAVNNLNEMLLTWQRAAAGRRGS